MNRSRAADDFAAIRARMEELRRERAQAAVAEDPPPARPRLPVMDCGPAPAPKPGLPGWRVAARRRLAPPR